MLTVTNSALQHLHQAIDKAESQDGCFRMVAKGDNTVGLLLEAPAEGDETFEHEGATVLAMPQTLKEPLSQRILDIDEGGQLVLIAKAS